MFICHAFYFKNELIFCSFSKAHVFRHVCYLFKVPKVTQDKCIYEGITDDLVS